MNTNRHEFFGKIQVPQIAQIKKCFGINGHIRG